MRDLTTPLSNAARGSVLAAPALVGAGDPGSTRLVYAMVVGLVVIGVVFVLLGIWLFRATRYDPPVLAPLERMGDRDWRRQRDPATQRRVLDEVRPEGAEPLRPESSPPTIDEEFELPERPVTSMSDLAPPLVDARSPTPQGIVRLDAIGLDDDVADGEGAAVVADVADVEDLADVVEDAAEIDDVADVVEGSVDVVDQ